MQTNEYHADCLQDTLNLKHFIWQKFQKAAQEMKHQTAPGASGIPIDVLLLFPKEGWQTIALIFKTIIRTGVDTDIFKVGIITLLAKSQTSHGTLSNIRPITVCYTRKHLQDFLQIWYLKESQPFFMNMILCPKNDMHAY